MKLVLTKDGSSTLFSTVYGQTFHSIHGALTESRHVFLDSSGTATRLRERQKTDILEIGLGAGLNFLLTADLALKHGTQLNYTAFEFAPLTTAKFDALDYKSLLGHPELVVMMRASLNNPSQQVVTRQGLIRLTVKKIDIRSIKLQSDAYDVVYLDAFCPSVNADCWTLDMLRRYFTTLRIGGKLSTYSARGSVRRAMQAVGFDVEKRPGPPGKREILVASRSSPTVQTRRN